MRATRLLGGVGALLIVTAAVKADPIADTTPLYQAKVSVDESQVRAGPSTTFYATNKLRKGDLVEVVGEEKDGWLRVLPPLDSSFSYVQLKHVEQFTQKVWVVKERTRPLIGSSIVGTKPNVEGPALAPGTQLESLGMSVPDQGETWLRIVPPRREVRYIDAREVQRVSDTDTPTVSKPTIGDKVPVIPVSQQRTTGDSSARTATFRPVDRVTEVTSTPFVPVVSTPLPGSCQPQDPSTLCVPITIHPISQPSATQGQWSGVAKLLRSGYTIDGHRAYRLVDKYDRLVMYVAAGSTVDLEPYVYVNVDLEGQLSYRGDYRANYMLVDKVVPAP
jgi:hypothetical protein